MSVHNPVPVTITLKLNYIGPDREEDRSRMLQDLLNEIANVTDDMWGWAVRSVTTDGFDKD